MGGKGWWVGVAGAILAVSIWCLLASRGPATGRAPVPRGETPDGLGLPAEAEAEGGGSLRVTIAVLPASSAPEWKLEIRDAAGRLHEKQGVGGSEPVIVALPGGGLFCTLRAKGFVGEIQRLKIEDDEQATAALTLRRLGRVSGTVRCDGVPVAGALVHLKIPVGAAASLLGLSPEDRSAGADRSVESGSDGRYGFEGVMPVPGISLVAASFDHAPVHAGPIDVEPGEAETLDFTLVPGAHLSGRIVDLAGAPSKGATVNILQRSDDKRIVGWLDEARARTDDEGRFVTPALSGPAMRMLSAWIVVDGVQQVIQHETLPPDRGTKDVGTLAPHKGIVQFELEGPVGDPPATLTVAVNGDPPGVGQTIVLSGAIFDREGRIRLAGLPVGEGFFTALNDRSAAFSDGKFRPTGGEMVVKVPALKLREVRPPPAESLIVDVAGQAGPAVLVLIQDGAFVMGRQVEEGSREPIVEKVSPGRYTLYVSAGDRYGWREIEQAEGQDLRVSIAPDRIGRSLSVLVLDEGKPVPRAQVSLRGFRKDVRGLKVPWAVAGEDGRAVLRGLPPDVTEVAILAMATDHGRGYRLDISGKDEVTVDLAKQLEED